MQDFWAVLFSPVAISKFTHTTSSGFLFASLFVVTISSWYLLKGRHVNMARKSILVASVFGLLSSGYVAFTGDEAAYNNAHRQPMKLAAFEGLWEGQKGAGLVAAGIVNPSKKVNDGQAPFLFEVRLPGLLSLLANRSPGSFVPGIKDLVYGNTEENIMGADEKIIKGKMALEQLALYKKATREGAGPAAEAALAKFNQNKDYLGFGYLNSPEEAVPPVSTVFYAFHIMVILGGLFPVIFLFFLVFALKDTLVRQKWLLILGSVSVFLGFAAEQCGWIVAEVGRQPWAIQNLLPVTVARSNLTTGAVQTTFFMFLTIFTILLIAEIKIMLKQIQIGPEGK